MMKIIQPSPAARQRPLPQAGEVKSLYFYRLREKLAKAKPETDEGREP